MTKLGGSGLVRIGLSIALVAMAACSTVAPASNDQPEAPCTSAEAPGFAHAFDGFIAGHPDFSGRIVAEWCGSIVYDRSVGMADREAGRPVTEQTLFDLGSLTKSLTAASVMALVDDGRLSLGDPLGRFFPDLGEDKAAITIRQLLTHTAGLPESPWEDGEHVTPTQYLGWVQSAPLAFAPGERWEYSNTGYSLLALIVEDISQKPIDRFWQTRFLEPHGIGPLGYTAVPERMAANYLANGDETPPQGGKSWGSDGPYVNLLGNGGIMGTPRSFLDWFEALHSGRLLSPASTEALFSPQVATGKPGEAYGFGWRLVERAPGIAIEHGGSNGASFYAALRHYDSTHSTLAFATNAFDTAAIRDLFRAFDLVQNSGL